jgi:hypothetical protein
MPDEYIENILIERQEEVRMAHIQQETLQMLVSFLIPFKGASLQLQVDTYATLPLVLPIRFNFLSHLNVLVSDSHELVELKNHDHMILNEKFTIHKLQRTALFLWPNFHQLRMLSTQEQEETIAGFDVLTAVSTKMAVFWVVALCSLVEVNRQA